MIQGFRHKGLKRELARHLPIPSAFAGDHGLGRGWMAMHPSKLTLESFGVMSPQGRCDDTTGLPVGLHEGDAYDVDLIDYH